MNSYLAKSLLVFIYLTTIDGRHYPSHFNLQDTNTMGPTSSGSSPLIIPVAVTRHHPIEYVNFNLDASEDRQPKTIHVDGGNTPLNIIFSPISDHLRVADHNDKSFSSGKTEHYTKSEEEPVYMYHQVNTPVFEDEHQDYQDYQDHQDHQDYEDHNNNYKNSQNNWHSSPQTLYR